MALSIVFFGTGMPAFRAARRAWSWVMVVEPSSKLPPSCALTYPHPPLSVWALAQNSTAFLRMTSSFFRRSASSSSPPTTAWPSAATA